MTSSPLIDQIISGVTQINRRVGKTKPVCPAGGWMSYLTPQDQCPCILSELLLSSPNGLLVAPDYYIVISMIKSELWSPWE